MEKPLRKCKYNEALLCDVKKCKENEEHMYFCKRWYEKI